MAKSEVTKIIVGLGNPGKEYEDTYHNVGQWALSMLEKERALSLPGKDTQTHKGDFILVRPLTYMNDSGKAVREALKKFHAKPEHLVVIHDDSDITVGNYKISFARSSAGHKGVQSIIDNLKTNEFTRVRIGIRPAREARRKKAGEFALKKITPQDKKTFFEVFKKVSRELIPPNHTSPG